jgi:uncharacterized membrane protein YidH (DUF202 family)
MTPGDDIEDGDPGLARERTRLAWTRTAISFAALGAAFLKRGPLESIPVLALSTVVWKLGQLPLPSRARLSQPRRLLVITVAITGISLLALIISFLGHPSSGLVSVSH